MIIIKNKNKKIIIIMLKKNNFRFKKIYISSQFKNSKIKKLQLNIKI